MDAWWFLIGYVLQIIGHDDASDGVTTAFKTYIRDGRRPGLRVRRGSTFSTINGRLQAQLAFHLRNGRRGFRSIFAGTITDNRRA